MPTRQQTISDAIFLFEGASYPRGLDVSTAWLGVYQVLLWYEPVNVLNFTDLPHIIDADKLRPTGQREWKSPTAWQTRAQLLSDFLASSLDCPADAVSQRVDRLMRHQDYMGRQRQNTLGIAFSGLIAHVLKRFGAPFIAYDTERAAGTVFPGIAFPGRSATPRIDLLGFKNEIPRIIFSAKWSLRHDRLSDITNECPTYKAAYNRIFRGHADKIPYYVLTNEYDPSRLGKIIEDSCVDGVVHVCKSAVVDVCKLNGRAEKLIDLSEFAEFTRSL